MIVIAVDVSGSVSADEYEIQKKGVVAAFRDPSVQRLLDQCTMRGVGVTYVEWSGSRSGESPVQQVIPWTALRNPSDMEAFAQKLSQTVRSSEGDTDIAFALSFSNQLFRQAPFESGSKIVSLSTDGQQSFTTVGVDVEDYVKMARDRLAENSITINAIAIEVDPTNSAVLNSFPVQSEDKSNSLESYLKRNVITGPNPIVTPVSDFNSYKDVFKKQISVMFNGCIS